MRVRPRYSLLTLLVLTSLIAAGVKLWYGPHHLVERSAPNVEVEYTFTRDWHGERIIQGPCVRRLLSKVSPVVDVKFCRSGTMLSWFYSLSMQDRTPDYVPQSISFPEHLKLTTDEQHAWKTAIEREAAQLAKLNLQPSGIGWNSVPSE